jgi:hypothetical protein
MNCDQVFDILTRGPFPTGTACDAGVEAHLNVCPECRRLAEALRPAIELFQEAIGPEESRDLPGYWCAVATDRKQPGVSFAPKIEALAAAPSEWPSGPQTRWAALARNWSALTAWRMAAMLALGVTLGLLLNSRVAFDGLSTVGPALQGTGLATQGTGAVPPAGNKHEPRLTPAQRAELATLPAACTRNRPVVGPRNPVRGDRLLLDADLTNVVCCSECHNANSDKVPGAATAAVSQRCQMCH